MYYVFIEVFQYVTLLSLAMLNSSDAGKKFVIETCNLVLLSKFMHSKSSFMIP